MTDQVILNRLSLRQLRYFEAVALARSFRKAAEKLHMSQPPLTQSMKALEQTLGVKLFEREGRGIRLTPAAEELLDASGQIFQLIARTVRRVGEVGHASVVRLRVGTTDDYLYGPIIERILRFDEQAPAHAIDTVVELSTVLIRQLHDGVIDLALTLASDDPPPRGLIALPLPPSRIMALVHREHRLASRSAISLKDLDGEPMITMPEGWPSIFAQRIAQLIAGIGSNVRITHQTTNSLMIQNLVEQKRGVAFISEYSVRDTSRSVRIPIKGGNARLEHVLLLDQNRSEQHRELVNAILSE